ncbi:hypothetical protein [Amycolatopsis pithecellobii]|uniref:Uncharacterized protein n=1 Tax=Amycolatopsis pithecellobii TaxID=664692 RepID=A0A6N7YNQ4_9PSEU|nr:hypothetical protein [Amycolatopsis pithecellobii]MTD54637.1 hypothetical protein [Amycolatopsis pithecellobii]
MRRDGRLSQHMIGPSRIRVDGPRAPAEAEGMLLIRATVHDVEIDVTALVH